MFETINYVLPPNDCINLRTNAMENVRRPKPYTKCLKPKIVFLLKTENRQTPANKGLKPKTVKKNAQKNANRGIFGNRKPPKTA